jgi:hypothetical protein
MLITVAKYFPCALRHSRYGYSRGRGPGTTECHRASGTAHWPQSSEINTKAQSPIREAW